ncbi:hypothetical protein NDU88_002024 [Pleurodeles waltl]|uniref:Uncharacterized protein n=1 Tax=Pleurodeles waltl TaxID=8319 RepID=A0AAV7W1A9_PLEWA|nr:hypothetical protein NDU88_002024 [Pleurodeles waltl]
MLPKELCSRPGNNLPNLLSRATPAPAIPIEVAPRCGGVQRAGGGFLTAGQGAPRSRAYRDRGLGRGAEVRPHRGGASLEDTAAPPCLPFWAQRACGPEGEGAGTHLQAAPRPGVLAVDHRSLGGPVARAPDERWGRAPWWACHAPYSAGARHPAAR